MWKNNGWLLLLTGTFANTQVNIGGNIGLSELVACIMAPCFFFSNYNKLRNDGFMLIVNLAILTVIGALASSIYNQSSFAQASRGVAATYALFSSIILFHHLLRGNFSSLRWALLGFAISSIVNAFYFHYGSDAASVANNATGLDAAVSLAQNQTLFWVSRLEHWVQLPMRGWYFQTPIWYSVLAPLLLAVFCFAYTASGRSAALTFIGASLIVLIGRKSRIRYLGIGRHFGIYCLIAFLTLVVFKGVYSCLAERGLLNEDQEKKYEMQTKGGSKTSLFHIIISGRTEFFAGLFAAIDRPIMGYGPWPIDTKGYYFDFVEKYGDIEDYETYYAIRNEAFKNGRLPRVPSHSIIIEFWQWFGVMGFVFWCAIICQIFAYFRKYVSGIPQWFGFCAASAPWALWHILFSPFGGRMFWGLFIVALYFNRAVAKGRLSLQDDMLAEYGNWYRRK